MRTFDFSCDASFDIRDQPDVPLFLADVDMVSLAKVFLILAAIAILFGALELAVWLCSSHISSSGQRCGRCSRPLQVAFPSPTPTSHAIRTNDTDLPFLLSCRCDVLCDEDVATTFDAASRLMPDFCSVVNTAGVAANGQEGAQKGGWTRIMDINAGGTIR